MHACYHNMCNYAALCISGTSAKRHDGTELCSILNCAIREDDPNTTVHAVVFANAINMLIMSDDDPPLWLQTLFPEKYPYVIGWVDFTCPTA